MYNIQGLGAEQLILNTLHCAELLLELKIA